MREGKVNIERRGAAGYEVAAFFLSLSENRLFFWEKG
jgi:hypothetical protein